MTDTLVTLEVTDGVGLLLLNRPPVNALNEQLRDQLVERSLEAQNRDDVRAVIVAGAGKHFAAGADIAELENTSLADMSAKVHRLQSSLGALARIEKPTIAAVNGYALGGGLEIALACDFRIIAETAKLGLPEIQLGVIPGGGGTQRLARLVGPAIAKSLLYTGRQVGADEAARIGLADEVVPADRTLGRARELAASLALGPALALRAAKLTVDEGIDEPLETGLALERSHFLALFGSEDRTIGMRSFRENGPGKANFVGR
jgi:enoyl-CoA hydratase/carnithine racemase